MKKYIIKSISIILTIILFTTIIPMPSYAYEYITSGDWTYQILENGTAKITSVMYYDCKYAYSGTETEIVIPEEVDGYIVTEIGRQEVAFSATDIISLTIPNTVTSIDGYTFEGCKLLSKVKLSENISEISYNTFSSCISLTEIIIPESVTEIGNSAFSQCTSLSSVSLPQGLHTIGKSAFSGCTALKNIIIPESVTSIGANAFPTTTTIYGYLDSYAETYADQYGLDFVAISKYANDTIYTPITKNKIELTKYLGNESIFEIPATIDDYSVVAVADEAFKDNNYITEITASNSLLYVGVSAFEDCKNLTSVVFPESVETIGAYAFADCKKLSKVVLPLGLTTIDEYTFKNCQSLASIIIPESVTEIDLYAFYNCLNLNTIYGTTGSYAEAFANENGYEFVDVSNMIVDVTATSVTIIENAEGYESFDNNGNEFFYYYTNFMYNDVRYEVKYGSGKTEKLDCWELEELTGSSFDFADNQYEKPFELGTNKITFTCGDISGYVELIIVENPVVSISISDIAVIEGTCGYFADEYDDDGNTISQYYHYSSYATPFTASLKDGTTITSSKYGNVELYGMNYSLDVSDEQSTEHWGVGTHTAVGSLFGITDEFTVTVTETPIASIVCEDIEIIENTNGYFTTGYNPETDDWDMEYFNYYTPLKCTITMKNGDIIECDDQSDFEYNGESYYIQIADNQYNSPWVLGGTYTLSFWFMDVYAEYDVTIVETDIQTMTVTPSRPLYEGLDSKNGIYVYSNSLDYSLNIVYKDGTTEVVTYTARNLMDSNSLRFNDTQLENPWGIGTNTVTASYRGYTTEFEIQVLENPFESLTISSEDGLTLYFNKKEGGVVEAHPYDLDARRGDFGCAIGMLFTDIGNFETYIYFKTNETSGESYNNKNVRIVIGDMESNTLEENNWYKVRVDSETLLYNAAFFRMNGYNGEITAENIDDVISTAMCFYDMYNNSLGSVIIEDLFYYIFNADEIIAAVKNLFGVEIDITMSELYDIETNTIKVKEFSGGDAIPIFDVSYSNNTWTAIKSYNYEGMRTFKVEWTDDLTVKSINWCKMKFDANSDGVIDSADYEKVVGVSTVTDTLTASEELATDANGDGVVDAFDAIYLDLYLKGML